MNARIPRDTAKSIIEATLYSSVGSFFVRGFSVVGYGVVIAQLSLHDYGVVVLLLSFLTPAVAFVLFGFERMFVSSVASARGEGRLGFVKGLMREYFLLAGALAFVFFAAAFLFRAVIARSYDVFLFQYFWVVAAVILGQMLFNGVQIVLEGFERLKHLALLQSVESLVRNAAIIVLAPHLNIASVIVLYAAGKFAASAAGFSAVLPVLRELGAIRVRPERRALFTLIRHHGKWEIAQKMLDQLTAPLKVWVIRLFVNVEGVAVYDFAQKIYSVIISALPVKAVVFPIISRTIAERSLARAIIVKSKKYMLLFYIAVYAAALAISPAVIERFFPQYRGEILVVAVVLLHLFVEVYKLGQGALLYALKEQRYRFFIFYPSLAVQVILTIVMTRAWSVIGTVVAWHLEGVIFGFITNQYLTRRFGMGFWDSREFFRFDEYDRWLLRGVRIRLKRVYGSLIRLKNRTTQ